MTELRRTIYGPLFAALLLSGCVVSPAYGPDYVVAPALPMVVELGVEPYYVHDGFFYYYHDNGWSYSRDRAGPWRALPPDRYPREIRYKNRGPRGRDHDDRD